MSVDMSRCRVDDGVKETRQVISGHNTIVVVNPRELVDELDLLQTLERDELRLHLISRLEASDGMVERYFVYGTTCPPCLKVRFLTGLSDELNQVAYRS